jgi:hypothetical protein
LTISFSSKEGSLPRDRVNLFIKKLELVLVMVANGLILEGTAFGNL